MWREGGLGSPHSIVFTFTQIHTWLLVRGNQARRMILSPNNFIHFITITVQKRIPDCETYPPREIPPPPPPPSLVGARQAKSPKPQAHFHDFQDSPQKATTNHTTIVKFLLLPNPNGSQSEEASGTTSSLSLLHQLQSISSPHN